MHIILAALGTIVTILILLNRLAEAGIDLGGLNPFFWQRRRQWKKKYQGNPVYSIESPMEMTALLMTATAKADGDMSSEEKIALLRFFKDEFHMSRRDAAGMLISSAHIFGNGEEVRANLEKVLKPSLEEFSEEQAQSALKLLESVCEIDSAGNELKREFVERVRQVFQKQFKSPDKWQ
jgi:uncharacterized tellurite resistance protein B-like protein